MLFAILVCEGRLREPTAELSTFSPRFCSFPFGWVPFNFLVGLAMILKHLPEGIPSAHQAEVTERDLAWDSLFLLHRGSFSLSYANR